MSIKIQPKLNFFYHRVVEKSPVKVIKNVSEYFGSKPVERNVRKSQKRKEVTL
jgi:hypothetical protein